MNARGSTLVGWHFRRLPEKPPLAGPLDDARYRAQAAAGREAVFPLRPYALAPSAHSLKGRGKGNVFSVIPGIEGIIRPQDAAVKGNLSCTKIDLETHANRNKISLRKSLMAFPEAVPPGPFILTLNPLPGGRSGPRWSIRCNCGSRSQRLRCISAAWPDNRSPV